MSGQLRTLKKRIRSVESTQKITRAMEMVAAAKLHRFQELMAKARPFTANLESLIARLNPGENSEGSTPAHPFFEQREEKSAALIVITSDTGLCGSYNNNLITLANRFLVENRNKKTVLITIGKSGLTALSRAERTIEANFTDTRAARIDEILKGLQETVKALYLDKKVDAVYAVYSHFVTLSRTEETLEKILPFGDSNVGATRRVAPTNANDYILEPSSEVIFRRIVPLYFEAKLRMVFLESIVSEQIARMTAMHMATQNAKEMIDSLVLLRNKARQAAITKELIEIVSGAKALKVK